MATSDRDRLLSFLLAAPHGALAMSREVPGLVETSNNLAVVTTEETTATVLCAFRSSVNASLASLTLRIQALCQLAGAEARVLGSYPGWKPEPASALVRRAMEAYEGLFGQPPAVKAVHAGLECGILVEKLPGLEAVSIGPEIRGAHSPDERANIPSVAKFYRWLCALLADLAG
jgi:dipeptidase D